MFKDFSDSLCLRRLSLQTFHVRYFGQDGLDGSLSFFPLVVCPFCHPDLRSKLTGGVIAGGAWGGGRIMPMLPRIWPTGQLAASLCPVNDQAATLTGELPIHNIQPQRSSSPGPTISHMDPVAAPAGQIWRSGVGQAGSVWPGLPPPANHPLVGPVAGGCALNSAPPMAAASGGAGKGVRGSLPGPKLHQGPPFGPSRHTSTHFFHPGSLVGQFRGEAWEGEAATAQ